MHDSLCARGAGRGKGTAHLAALEALAKPMSDGIVFHDFPVVDVHGHRPQTDLAGGEQYPVKDEGGKYGSIVCQLPDARLRLGKTLEVGAEEVTSRLEWSRLKG
jgi:hypothetical protein